MPRHPVLHMAISIRLEVETSTGALLENSAAVSRLALGLLERSR
jgi:hypothetical protein